MITIVKGLQQEVRELKHDVVQAIKEIKSKLENSPEYSECIIENPFDELHSFGFKAKSLEEVSIVISVV